MLSESACSVSDMSGKEPVVHTDYIISAAFRAMVDKMCFQAVYGSKTTFESKVPASVRAAFHKYVMDRHKSERARDEFAAAWKAYLRANPAEVDKEDAAADEAFMAMMAGPSDDEDGAAAAGAGTGARGANAATPPP